MNWVAWCIVIIPLTFIMGLAVYCRKYIRGVSDFLVCGRVAGRYVLNVADLEAGMSVLTLVAMVEQRYQVGYGILFWENVTTPLAVVLGLTGFCAYRYRETKAMSLGQFFEIRYNRAFRVFASAVKTCSNILMSIIGPAVAARFFIYLIGIPHYFTVFGYEFQTFTVVMFLLMVAAISIIMIGGSLALLITDSIQGLMSYPIFVIFSVFMLVEFSWSQDIAPVMMSRIPGESFCNPYDVEGLRDFNLFALVVTITSSIINRGSNLGGSTSSAARTPHEQKMSGILGGIRMGFGMVMCVLIALGIITVMNHRRYADQAREIRLTLIDRIAEEKISDPDLRDKISGAIRALPEHYVEAGKLMSRKNNFDTPYLEAVSDTLPQTPEGRAHQLEFQTLYHQMMMPVAMRTIMPPALVGVFCLLMAMLVISTDDSRIFDSAVAIAQDMILPFLKKPLTLEQHLWMIRGICLLVGLIFFVGSLYLSQLDFINLFITIMGSIWLGGAGPVMIGGLYTKFGTTTGAFAALITGSSVSVGGILLQRNWPDAVYPWLVKMGWHEHIGNFLSAVSGPFNPYILWEMDAIKCPINSKEFFFMAIWSGVAAYLIGSFLTYRRPFNLERMLHRGKYAIDGEKRISSPWTWHNLYMKLIGITPEYTLGDKITVFITFTYSIVWVFFCLFLGSVIWNAISPWKPESWANYVLVRNLISPMTLGVFTTVWFWIGGVIDIRRLFRDLAARKESNPLDDGRVEGNMSLADKAILEKRDAESTATQSK